MRVRADAADHPLRRQLAQHLRAHPGQRSRFPAGIRPPPGTTFPASRSTTSIVDRDRPVIRAASSRDMPRRCGPARRPPRRRWPR